MRSVRSAFDRLQILSDLGDLTQQRIEKRWISCATVEEGTVALADEQLQPILSLAHKIVQMSGAVFPKEAEFYGLVKQLEHTNIWALERCEREFLWTLTKDDFLYANTHFSHGWRLQTSRFCIGGSKIGRNIEGRYKTGIKPETKVEKSQDRSSLEESEVRHGRRLKSNAKKSV